MRSDSIGAITAGYDKNSLRTWQQFDPSDRYLKTIRLKNLLVATDDDGLLGCAGLLLSRQRLIATFVHPDCGGRGIGGMLVTAIEERAREFGITRLFTDSALNATPFYLSCGFVINAGMKQKYSERTEMVADLMEKALVGDFNEFQGRIRSMLQHLGIPHDYGISHQMPMQPETSELSSIGTDVFDRQQSMLPAAAAAWNNMCDAAQRDNVSLLPVSAFRTVDYQAGLVQKKIDSGQLLEEILQVSAAPGFSEHHTGRAIDIASCRENALEECFEKSNSFDWLGENAATYGFSMSFPRDNMHRIAYEPWHWAWHGAPGSE